MLGISNDKIKESKYTEFQQPVLTRWWTVGASACQIDDEWEIWHGVNEGISKLPNKYIKSAANDIVSANLNLMGMKAYAQIQR